jgi:hypothetical protein
LNRASNLAFIHATANTSDFFREPSAKPNIETSIELRIERPTKRSFGGFWPKIEETIDM